MTDKTDLIRGLSPDTLVGRFPPKNKPADPGTVYAEDVLCCSTRTIGHRTDRGVMPPPADYGPPQSRRKLWRLGDLIEFKAKFDRLKGDRTRFHSLGDYTAALTAESAEK